MIRLAMVMALTKKALKNYEAEYLRHQMKLKSVYMSMRIFQEYRKRLRRYGAWRPFIFGKKNHFEEEED